MKICNNCKIEIDGDRKTCPFCQNSLSGTASEYNWPPVTGLKKKAFLYKIQLFIVLMSVVVGLSLDFLLKLNNGIHYSLIIAMWGLSCEFLIRHFIKNYSAPAKIVTISVVTVAVLAGITSYYLCFFEPVFYIAIPSLTGAVVVANFIFALFDKHRNALVYLLCSIILGTVPYIVLKLGNYEHLLAWTICLMISIVTFLAIVIFKGREVLSELQKRFNF